MNDTKFLPDDPKVTAYALGELEGAERAAVEAALRHDPAMRLAVEEIRATATQLAAALAEEGQKEGPPATVVPFPAVGKAVAKDDPYSLAKGEKLRRFPRIYFLVGGLAAACFALMAVLNPPPPARPDSMATVTGASQKVLIDMNTLVRSTEPATPAVASAGVNGPADARTNDGAASVATAPAAPRTLLEQTKAPDQAVGGGMPMNLQLNPSPGSSVAFAPPAPGPRLIGPLGTDTGSAPTKILTASTTGEGRVLTYPADEKFVVQAVPAQPKQIGGGPRLAAGGRDIPAMANETRGLPGSQLKDVTPITNFDTVAPAGVVEGAVAAPGPTVAQAGQVPAATTGSGQLIYLSPFMVSADRFGNASAAANSSANVRGGVSGASPAFLSAAQEKIALPPTPANAQFDRGANNTEAYAYAKDNDFLTVAQNPFSTFSVDADTASYANVRRFIQNKQKPPRDAVRIEELLNYFSYRYPPPAAKSDAPLAASLEVAEAPWAPTHRLVRIGLKGREITTAERAAANLVFLLDVSGSMNAPNRLPLVKESMRMLLGKLRADDRVAIVTYAGQSGLALPSTPVARAREIVEALDHLAAGGSTNGAMGIQLAYDIAKANQVTGGINRVILCTDGDFNVGMTSEGELVRLIEEKAKSGVFLTVLGFGMGNLKDSTLEKLADKGNGNYGYIDSRKEAEKILVRQVNGTLVTIAKDVKIQVEFNPSLVASYRLIGYENRMLKKEDFNNDKVDAGEIGAGHTVTALYEIIPASVVAKTAKKEPEVEDRRYNFYGGVTDNATVPGRIDPYGKELLNVKVRYKKPNGFLSSRLDFPLTDAGGKFADASPDFKFAAAVAGFGMILRESPHKGTATMANVIEWAEAGTGEDAGGYRSEFIELARQADALEK